VLLSGDHAAIARWRREQALRTTLARRPDLLDAAPLDDADVRFLRTLGWSGRQKTGEDG
jgi:tRNA (guanine37-N1)-methyltransferase